MERRHFLQLAVGFAAGAAALTAGAQAVPLSPHPLGADQRQPPANQDIRSAVTTEAEVEHLKPRRSAGITTGTAIGTGAAAGTAVTGNGFFPLPDRHTACFDCVAAALRQN